MDDPGRNDPAGYESVEPPQRYRIREVLGSPIGSRYQLRGFTDPEYTLGEVVERQTSPTFDQVTKRYHHALNERDQFYADLCTRLVQRACGWFYDAEWVPLLGAPDIRMTDDQVQTSIFRLNHGENEREGVRMGKPWYDLEKLPWKYQRALVEQLYALRAKFAFEKLGPIRPMAVQTPPADQMILIEDDFIAP